MCSVWLSNVNYKVTGVNSMDWQGSQAKRFIDLQQAWWLLIKKKIGRRSIKCLRCKGSTKQAISSRSKPLLEEKCDNYWFSKIDLKNLSDALLPLKVDIFGRGNKILPKTGDGFQWLSTNYKFYLAFENSNCRDYITEKVSHNALKYVNSSVSSIFMKMLFINL